MKYVRVMDGDISNQSGLKFKIDEVNECDNWNPNETSIDKAGGINFSNEENILRWIRRGDTIYDVYLPQDAQIIKLNGTFTPNGLFRANKIIVKNPRKIDEKIIDELYKKSNMPDDTYYTVLGILAQKGYEKTCFDLINDKVNKNNIDRVIEVYKNYEIEHQDVAKNPGLYHKYLKILMNIKDNKLTYPKYVKVIDGLKSNAGGFEYKLNEVNVATNFNPEETNPEKMGGFNFGTEDKILRWLHRGDTIYDVEVPNGAKVIDCESVNCPHGVFRSDKIIIKNPRLITDEVIIDLYNKSNLPEKTYYQCLVVLLYRYHTEAAKYIIQDRINENNIEECIKEFENMAIDKRNGKEKFSYDDLWDEAKEIYDMLKSIKHNKLNKF